ncbi:unnamed protein product [Caenorhabditis sp. 36 PRJEB53466]|nr:unnamed protein product [Caenorhabditis sp. 36 PRJEB53466]
MRQADSSDTERHKERVRPLGSTETVVPAGAGFIGFTQPLQTSSNGSATDAAVPESHILQKFEKQQRRTIKLEPVDSEDQAHISKTAPLLRSGETHAFAPPPPEMRPDAHAGIRKWNADDSIQFPAGRISDFARRLKVESLTEPDTVELMNERHNNCRLKVEKLEAMEIMAEEHSYCRIKVENLKVEGLMVEKLDQIIEATSLSQPTVNCAADEPIQILTKSAVSQPMEKPPATKISILTSQDVNSKHLNQEVNATNAFNPNTCSRTTTGPKQNTLVMESSETMQTANAGLENQIIRKNGKQLRVPEIKNAIRRKGIPQKIVPEEVEIEEVLFQNCASITNSLTEEARLRFKGPSIPERKETTQSRIHDILALAVREMEMARFAGLEDQITRIDEKQSGTPKLRGAARRKGIPHKIVPEEEAAAEPLQMDDPVPTAPHVQVPATLCSAILTKPRADVPEVGEPKKMMAATAPFNCEVIPSNCRDSQYPRRSTQSETKMFAMNKLQMETTSPAVQAPIEKEEVIEMEAAPVLQAEEPMEVDRDDNLDKDSSFEGPTVRAFLMAKLRSHNPTSSSSYSSKKSVAVPNRRIIPGHYISRRDEPDPVLWAIHQKMAATAASASTPITPNAPNALAGRSTGAPTMPNSTNFQSTSSSLTPMDVQSKRASLDYYDPQVTAQKLAALQKISDPVLPRNQEIVKRNRQLQQASNRGDHQQLTDNDSQKIPQQFVPPMQRNQQHHAARQSSTPSQSPPPSRYVMIAPRPIPGAPVSRIVPVGFITMDNLQNRQHQQVVIRQSSVAQDPPAPQGSSSRATSRPLTAQPSRPVMFDGSVIEKPKKPEYYNVSRIAMSDPVCPPGKGPNTSITQHPTKQMQRVESKNSQNQYQKGLAGQDVNGKHKIQESSAANLSNAKIRLGIASVLYQKSRYKELSKAMRVAYEGFLESNEDATTDQLTLGPISDLPERYRQRADARIPLPPEEIFDMEDACEIHADQLIAEEARPRFKRPLIPKKTETVQTRIDDMLGEFSREMMLTSLNDIRQAEQTAATVPESVVPQPTEKQQAKKIMIPASQDVSQDVNRDQSNRDSSTAQNVSNADNRFRTTSVLMRNSPVKEFSNAMQVAHGGFLQSNEDATNQPTLGPIPDLAERYRQGSEARIPIPPEEIYNMEDARESNINELVTEEVRSRFMERLQPERMDTVQSRIGDMLGEFSREMMLNSLNEIRQAEQTAATVPQSVVPQAKKIKIPASQDVNRDQSNRDASIAQHASNADNHFRTTSVLIRNSPVKEISNAMQVARGGFLQSNEDATNQPTLGPIPGLAERNRQRSEARIPIPPEEIYNIQDAREINISELLIEETRPRFKQPERMDTVESRVGNILAGAVREMELARLAGLEGQITRQPRTLSNMSARARRRVRPALLPEPRAEEVVLQNFDVDNSTNNVDNSTNNVDNSTNNVDNSTNNVDNSTNNVDNSTNNVDNSTNNVDNSTNNVDNSTNNVDNSTNNFDNSTNNVDNSTNNVDNSTNNVDNSTNNVAQIAPAVAEPVVLMEDPIPVPPNVEGLEIVPQPPPIAVVEAMGGAKRKRARRSEVSELLDRKVQPSEQAQLVEKRSRLRSGKMFRQAAPAEPKSKRRRIVT